MKPAAPLLVLLALTLGSPTTSAEEKPRAPNGYVLAWTFEPHAVPAEPLWVKEQAQIVETRLLPTALYGVDADVKDAKGQLLIAAGGQLAGLKADKLIACTVPKAATGLAKSNRVCLVDSDGDMKVARYFTRGGGGDYWFTLEDELPSTLNAVAAPLALVTLDPKAMIGAPLVSLHYQRILDGGIQIPLTQEGGNMVRFHLKVGAGKRREWMIRECRAPVLPSMCTSTHFPSTLKLAGLELEVLERRKEDIKVRVIAPFGGIAVKFREIDDGFNSGEMLLAD
jgi:hypothetical protein